MGKVIFLVLTLVMIGLSIYFGLKKYKLVEERKREREALYKDKWSLALDYYDKGMFKESLPLIEEVMEEYPDFRDAFDLREIISEVIKRERVEKASVNYQNNNKEEE